MKSALISMLVLSMALTGLAEGQDKAPARRPTREQVHAAMQRSNMRRFGGRIRQPNSERGRIVFVNAQDLVEASVLAKFVEDYRARYRYTMEVTDKDCKSGKGTIVIRIENTDREERIVLAPENFWVSVNVRALAADNPPKAILKNRFEQELKRAFAFVCCGTCGDNAGGICGVVNGLSDIDAIGVKLYTPDVEIRIANNMPFAGLEPYRVCKYSEAVQEGWAPAPTNEFQKAIWDKVHAVPSDPMKIEFDPKKGK